MVNTISKGILGVVAPATGYAVSLSNVESWLRILSLLGGFAVSCAMFVSIGFTIQKKYRAWKDSKTTKKRFDPNANYEEETTTT